MGKLLTWVVFFALAWLAWKFVTLSARKSAARRVDETSDASAARSTAVERMLSCAHCGAHFPSSEGVQAQGRDYCCASHRDAGPRR